MRRCIPHVYVIPLALVAALTGCTTTPPAAARGADGSAGERIAVTVHEGTEMAAALSPDKRTIVIDLQGTLFTLPAAGGAATRITDEYNDARQPSWSPDGRTIAFQGYRDGTWRVWTVAPDGSGLKSITSGPFDDREPIWSPDGRTIAFSSDRSGNYDIWTLDVASGQVRQLTTNPANEFFPTWSPDGREIAFVSNRTPSPGVYATTLDGHERLLAEERGSVGAPSWRPDGQQVLYSVIPGSGVAPAGEPALMLGSIRLASGEDYFPFRAQWLSPTEFLYTADGKIKRRSVDGGAAPATIDFSATLDVTVPHYPRKARDFDSTAPQLVKGLIRPTMTGDQKQLAFAALGDVYTMPVGGKPVQVTNDAAVDLDPAWSPDGTKLAFSSDRAGSEDIYIRDLKAGTDRRLTSMPDSERSAVWSPDGQSIAFVSYLDFYQGEVYVVAAAGGTPRKVVDRSFGPGIPSWTGDGRSIVAATLKHYSSRFREGMNYYLIVPIAGGEPKLVMPNEHEPTGNRSTSGPVLSPGGRQLAFVRNGRLFVMPTTAAGEPAGAARQLTIELADEISWAGPNHVLYIATDRLKLVSTADGSARDVPVDLTFRRHNPAGRIVVHAGRLVDGRSEAARTDVDIVIEGHRIRSVEPHSTSLHAGRVVDATGLSVMPGLIEAHGHVLKDQGTLFGRALLAYGVTAVRSPGNVPYDALEEREAVESGRRPGPRLFMAGYLTDGWRPYYPIASPMIDESTVDAELDRAKRLDYDLLKTYVRLPDLLQKHAIEGAHRIGIPVTSHEIYPAALSGVDSVEHTGATSRRGYSPKQSGTGRAYEDVIQIIARSGMTITPTAALGGYQAAIAVDASLLADPRFQKLQPSWVRNPANGRRGAAPGSDPQALAQFAQRAGPTLMALLRAGVPVLAGTDTPLVPYGLSLHAELAADVAAGYTPFQALQTATVHTAKLLNADRDLGTIEPGKLADLVIVEGNPLASIADAMKVRTVIKNGEVFPMEVLLDGTGAENPSTAR